MEIDIKALDMLPAAEESWLYPCTLSCFGMTCEGDETCFITLSLS
ncbi:ALQxL family class IV lanthipeptide [Nonomuraea angiospora]|jgi:hypothetical protein